MTLMTIVTIMSAFAVMTSVTALATLATLATLAFAVVATWAADLDVGHRSITLTRTFERGLFRVFVYFHFIDFIDETFDECEDARRVPCG